MTEPYRGLQVLSPFFLQIVERFRFGMISSTISRVSITAAASSLIEKLKKDHGGLMFHQSGGCCDGSAPMCYQENEFRVGGQDIFLGEIDGCPVYIGAKQFDFWAHTHLIIDAVPGRGQGFSLEAPEGMRFLTRSRVFTDAENALLAKQGNPMTGTERPPTS